MIEAGYAAPHLATRALKLVELLKQAIYEDVAQEFVDDALINIEPDKHCREIMHATNGGVADALDRIRDFGKEEEE
jgi:hypothetical protein